MWACPAVILLLEGCAWGGILPHLPLLCFPGQLCESGHVLWALQSEQRMSGGLGKPQSWAQTPSLGQGQRFSIQQGAGIFVLVEQGVAGLRSCGLQLLEAADAQAVPREQLEGKAG